jgi:plastocyanin
VILVAGGVVALMMLLGSFGSSVAAPVARDASPGATNVTIDVSATTQLSFVPNSFSVPPGATVHLVVTQLADFDHTFTMSPVANGTVPASDDAAQVAQFFNTHAPLVNLSLGDVGGAVHYDNFTAPTQLGSYEYLCLIHFPSMTGTVVVTNGGSGSSSALSIEEYAAIAVLAVVIVVVLVAAVRRRKPAAPPEGGTAPRP